MIQNVFNAIVFYLAYFLLIQFMLKKRNLTRPLLYGLAFIILLSFLRFLINPWVKDVLGAFEKWPISVERQIFYASFWTFMFFLYSVIIYLSIEWFKERSRRVEMAREKQKSEIDLLKSQVNPHFLMNTLNNLYSLVYKGSDRAGDAVLKLSEIMRYVLYDAMEEKVPLENEIKYLRSFIELQLLRFTRKEFLEVDIAGNAAGKMIAPMLLVPFVENAFKHGNKNLPGMGINVMMDVKGSQLTFEVNNFKSSKAVNKVEESGIGLKNIEKRLQLQYPGKHELIITDGIDFYNIRLILEL
jgi:LytS/YehU family sensor histidine kinase